MEKGLKEFLKKQMAAGVLKAVAIRKAKRKFNVSVTNISNMWINIKENDYPELCKNSSKTDNSLETYEAKKEEAIKNKNKAHTEGKEGEGKIIRKKKKKPTAKAREPQNEEIKTTLKDITKLKNEPDIAKRCLRLAKEVVNLYEEGLEFTNAITVITAEAIRNNII